MGVLACDRRGCDNIMCDYVSDEYGYLCWECLAELKSKPHINIGAFMKTQKSIQQKQTENWEEIVDNEFKSRHHDW